MYTHEDQTTATKQFTVFSNPAFTVVSGRMTGVVVPSTASRKYHTKQVGVASLHSFTSQQLPKKAMAGSIDSLD